MLLVLPPRKHLPEVGVLLPGQRQLGGVCVPAGSQLLHGVVHCGAVYSCGGGNVLGPLQTAFDLQARHPSLHQCWDLIESHEVLWAEKELHVAELLQHPVDQKAIGEPAGLCALPAVGGAAAPGLTGEALARVGHTHGAVHKGLHLCPCAAAGHCDLLCAELPADHDPLNSTQLSVAGALRGCDTHLGGAVDRQVWGDLPHNIGCADVLHDHGVHA
mmetsp:Transcript_10836/g.30732  ORF Transcript_10836/g.30732 Transcript_10836/m.30732 type:complete len:216 (+) Transcript_10836:262-909(+)